MDVRISGVRGAIQRLISNLSEIADWEFLKSLAAHYAESGEEYTRPHITIDDFLQCLGKSWKKIGEGDPPVITVEPARGPHACGTLYADNKEHLQFRISAFTDVYFPIKFDSWFLVEQGVTSSAITFEVFGRVGVVTDGGLHRSVRTIIMDMDKIDFIMSDDEDGTLSLSVTS